MKFDFRPTCARDADQLSDFLGRAFQLRSGAPLLDQKLMVWKYWTARPDWEGSRSFVAQHDGAIVAHVAVWPVRVRSAGQDVAAVHQIDWAANQGYPGAGLLLAKHVAARTRMMIATGGSEIARRILPVIGYRPHSELCQFASPVRPVRQAFTTAEKNWKLPARLLRNTFWNLSHSLSLPRGWSAKPVAPEEVPDNLWPRPSSVTAVTTRGAAFYRYFVDSPSVPHMLFDLKKQGQPVGFFCISSAPHVARIADLWLPSTNIEDWSAGFRTAAALAASDRHVYEVSAWASTALAKEGLTRAGFLLRERSAVSILGGANFLEGQELHLQMLDSDASFWSGEGVSYLT